jgi:hypothetical protein
MQGDDAGAVLPGVALLLLQAQHALTSQRSRVTR